MPRGPGTGFINWDRIQGLNQPAADRMAQGIAQPIAQQGDAAQQALKDYQARFGSAVKAGMGSTYTGPEDFGTYDAAALGKIQQQGIGAQTAAGLAGTAAGNSALLGANAHGAYSGGQNRWDSALLGGNQQLQQLGGLYGGFGKLFGQAGEAGAAQVKRGKTLLTPPPPAMPQTPRGPIGAPANAPRQDPYEYDPTSSVRRPKGAMAGGRFRGQEL